MSVERLYGYGPEERPGCTTTCLLQVEPDRLSKVLSTRTVHPALLRMFRMS